MRRLHKVIRQSSKYVICIITLIFLGYLLGCGVDSQSSPEATGHVEENGPDSVITFSRSQVAQLGVETVPVEIHTTGIPIELPGKIIPEPDQEAYVTSLISGRVEKVLVNEGDRVSKGEVLITVSGSELGTFIADLQNTRLELNRQQQLMNRGVGVQKQLQDARIAYAAAQQKLRAIGFGAGEIERLATGEQILDAMPLRSPIDGVVLERTAVTGGPVSEGDKLFYIVNMKPAWVQAEAYERDLEKINTGQSAEIRTAVYSNRTFTGAIERIIPQIDAGQRTAKVILEMPNHDEALKPGMFATVTILTDARKQPALPAPTIQTDGQSAFVLIAENDTTFRRRAVSARPDGAATYVGVPELPVGTTVVAQGAFQIISAMKGIQAEED